jgi:hypothetical protein
VEENLVRLGRRLDEIKAQVTPLTSTVQEVPINGTFNNGKITLAANAIAVRFNAVSVDGKTRGQYGGGVAPDVDYLGWYSFSKSSGGGGDRLPISYRDQTVEVPRGFDRLSFTCQGASEIAISVFYRRPSPGQNPPYSGPGYHTDELLYRGPS